VAKIEIKSVCKIFGPAPWAALSRARDGDSKERILAETGHTVGLNDVSLSIEEGETFVVMGLSGSGKSTLIRHLNRLIEPTAGRITVDGLDVLALNYTALRQFRRARTGMVFQRFGLLPHQTVGQNVAYGLEIRGMNGRERRNKAMEWIETVGLVGYENAYPSQLSGGMQQRVGLARALCGDPEILLMDEAFSALDPLVRSSMQDRLLELQDRLRKTIVFITHDLDEALKLGDRIAILKDGQLSQIGKPEEILLEPADDYVAAFVSDVNRGRVLTVEMIMRPPKPHLATERIDAALREMQDREIEYGFVFEKNRLCGMVAEEDLVTAVRENGGSVSLRAIAEMPRTVPTNTKLEDALSAILDAGRPIGVLDDDGRFRGVVSKRRLIQVLTKRPG
jgi:glycine betaine/proline transport system ATP-binding protein